MPRNTRALAALLCLASLSSFAQKPVTEAQARDFANNLLSKMTLAEKIGQMEQGAGQELKPEVAEARARAGEYGSFLFFTDPTRINQLQKIAVTESRLHIPLLFGYDVIHGFRTIFPVPLAMSSSWDPELVTRGQAIAADEARAAGIHWAFAPMVDIARDPRWGRIMETAGEDPFLGETMAAAQVRGFQGDYIGSPDHILACVKHFGGYGAAIGGRDYEGVDLSDDALFNTYLRPYHAAVKAGAASVMSAYMDLNSVPATGNVFLMRHVLREQWGFKGFVVSDWDAVKSLQTHGFAADQEDAAVRAVKAGINMEMTSSAYRDHLADAVREGKVTPAELDDLVRPLLEAKYRLGLFTNPYVDLAHFNAENHMNPAHRTAARLAAEQTAVLLRNQNHALPLSPSVRSVAVIGPLADSGIDTNGSWAIHGDRTETVTVAQGIREMLPHADVAVTTGVEITRGNKSIFDAQVPPPQLTLLTPEARAAEMNHALDLARKAEVTVLVLGEAQNMNGERASRANLTLPGEQQQLLERVVALGKPVVLVLMTGRPMDISWAAQHVPAILNVWYPGSEGGHAVANLLFGKANPGGHLTVTWPRSVGQVPLYYADNLTHIPNDTEGRYWDEPSSPLYPFGYGLSYASFTIDGLHVANANVGAGAPLNVSVTVHNTSNVAGSDTVQLYTHQRAGSASRPVRELKAFQKVMLAAGETKTIQLTVPAESLSFWSAATHKRAVEAGTFDVWVGDDATATLHDSFSIAQSIDMHSDE